MRVVLFFCYLVFPLPRAHAFAAGGGGFGSPKIQSGSKNKKEKKKDRTPRRRSDGVDLVEKPADDTENAPLLDKWGLPPPTVEDIFPRLPANTELNPATKSNHTLTEIQRCLRDCLDLQLHKSFDEQGTEILSPLQQQLKQIPMQLNLMHESPPVLRIDHFLSPDECQQIQNLALSSNECVMVESKTFPGALSQRTSTSWFAPYSAVPTFLAKTHHRLHIPLQHMEEPQIVRYRPGQLFSWHYDEVTPQALSNGGQRLMTLLVYLNTLETSGGTVFRDLRDSQQQKPLSMQPQQGSALIFFPAFRDGRPDDRTLHQGQAVVEGMEKWIVQMWIHENEYHAALPRGNLQASAVVPVQQAGRDCGYSINS